MAVQYDYLVKKYFSDGYNAKEITAAIGINHGLWKSVRTTQRCLRHQDLQTKGAEMDMEEIIRAVQEELTGNGRNLGVGQLWKILRIDRGLLVKRQTVRDIVQIIEPQRQAKMRKGRLHRRQYKVKGPNYIWHIDGNDKLKPYGFCISGAIDGWSRRIIWLEVDTTLYYLQAVERFGVVPRIVRMDKGTENVGIADVQTLLRSGHEDDLVGSSVMFGSSNHNQRIERWWSYCRNAILQSYMDLFKDLQLSGIINVTNVLHMECLKFCFMNILRKELWTQALIWNKHRVRAMKNTCCPSGVPEFLFRQPEYYNAVEQGQHVDMHVVSQCKNIYFHQQDEFGSADVFSEWALNVMVEKNLSLPDTFNAAYNLFSELILMIYAM